MIEKNSFADGGIIQDYMPSRKLRIGFSSSIVVTEKKIFTDDDIIQEHMLNRQF
jgi:hypothetical protein